MQKGDHVIVANLSLSLPLRQRPYLGRGHPLGHHDGVVPHVRGIGHRARLPQVRLPFPDDTRPDTTVIDTCSTCDATTATYLDHAERDPTQPRGPVGGGFHLAC